ncbi:MAG: L-2-amino-thiazoline-4-carboxylic acid hydrolase [Bacteroidales bacterium]|nr:L-2-amino-thiazoline-4-carboxylic acid hydrolase [Bacteroidales bacterium]
MKKERKDQEISHIKRREIQASIASPIINGFMKEFGKERTLEVLSKIIAHDAIDSGRKLAAKYKGNGMNELSKLIREVWCEEEALVIDVLKETDNEFHFNVTKCRYAEAYKKLNIQQLGKYLSCDRDFRFNEGFNPEIKLQRSQTIMEGADHCDFRYSKKESEK